MNYIVVSDGSAYGMVEAYKPDGLLGTLSVSMVELSRLRKWLYTPGRKLFHSVVETNGKVYTVPMPAPLVFTFLGRNWERDELLIFLVEIERAFLRVA